MTDREMIDELTRALQWALPYAEREHDAQHGDNDTAWSVLHARRTLDAAIKWQRDRTSPI